MDSDGYKRQGARLLAEAREEGSRHASGASSASFFGSIKAFFSGSPSDHPRYALEEAAEKCEKAANSFKAAQAFGEASEAFQEAGEYLLRAGENDLAVRHFVEAASVIRRDDPLSTTIREGSLFGCRGGGIAEEGRGAVHCEWQV